MLSPGYNFDALFSVFISSHSQPKGGLLTTGSTRARSSVFYTRVVLPAEMNISRKAQHYLYRKLQERKTERERERERKLVTVLLEFPTLL